MGSYRSWEKDTDRTLRIVLIVLIVALVAYLNRDAMQGWMGRGLLDPNATSRPVTPRGDLAADEQATIEIFERTSPSVVYVTTIERAYRRTWFGDQPLEIPKGTGSGFIWDEKGHVVTNYHVIQRVYEGAGSCEVTFKDQSFYKAKIVGVARDKDIAVLLLDDDAPMSKLRPIAVGSSHDLKVGQKVFAIGNPYGYDQSLTAGIISALGRSIDSVTGEKISDVIQTDAAINRGNSGGPLLDSSGRLIGVNTAIRDDAQNIGFAIPVDTVNDVVPQIIRYGGFRPGLGISLVRDQISRLHFERGVIIERVFSGSTAAKAGLRGLQIQPNGGKIVGDVIIEAAGKPINNQDDLKEVFNAHKVGDMVDVKVIRDGEIIKLPIQLQAIE